MIDNAKCCIYTLRTAQLDSLIYTYARVIWENLLPGCNILLYAYSASTVFNVKCVGIN